MLFQSEADQNAALEAGADLVGGVNLVKQIKVGEVMPSDYNYIVSHVDMLNELSNIRGILRKQYPSTGKGIFLSTHFKIENYFVFLILECCISGSMGVDMKSLIMRFKNGLEYVAEKDNVTHDFGWIEVSVGHVSVLEIFIRKCDIFRYVALARKSRFVAQNHRNA